MKLFLPLKPIILTSLYLLFSFYNAKAQAPCATTFTGFDPCSAEWLSVGLDCPSVAEEMRTNTCAGMSPASTSCGVTGTNIVWSKFVITTADNVTITWTTSNNRNIRIGLYQFTDPCDMDFDLNYGETEIACVNAGGNGVDETMVQFLAPGTYYVAGKSTGDLAAASQMCVHTPSATPPITASDCGISVDVCTNLNFTIDPNGAGAVNEIPASGSLGNPMYDQGITASMPGSWGNDNFGCLQTDETNSTWMVVNISSSGDLEFTFGGNGTQAGFYDWIMYPYDANSCTDIPNGTVAPVRCNWNGVSTGGTGLSTPCCLPAGGDATNFQDPLAVLIGEQYIICFSNFSSVSTSVPLEFGGTAGVSCVPLPIELLEFKAELLSEVTTNNPKINVLWSTLTEVKNDYFIIERSNNAIDFEFLERVEGAGNSVGLKNYQIIDNFPISGWNYYRLRQVDFDGEYEFSSIVEVNVKKSESIKISPNPASDKFVVDGVSSGDEIQIFNMVGQMVFEQKTSNKIEVILLDKFPKGNYIVRIIGNGSSIVEKLVVEH